MLRKNTRKALLKVDQEEIINADIEEACDMVKPKKKIKGAECVNCNTFTKGASGLYQCGVCASKYGGLGEQQKRLAEQELR